MRGLTTPWLAVTADGGGGGKAGRWLTLDDDFDMALAGSVNS